MNTEHLKPHNAPAKPFPTSHTRACWAELTADQKVEANRLMTENGLTCSAAIRTVRNRKGDKS